MLSLGLLLLLSLALARDRELILVKIDFDLVLGHARKIEAELVARLVFIHLTRGIESILREVRVCSTERGPAGRIEEAIQVLGPSASPHFW